MHIKQVVIRGFKTYKDQVSLPEDLHRGINVIVGFNGAGKSNFFNAILFVISDHFGALKPETRRALLHEGSGPAALTAFVELAFDNSDRRMPFDKDEVRIRRTIAAKKDDYMLDGRHATKAEVFGLLEGCGFSKSNPYYIVQQGKIAELTLMNDVRRLELLKEVSGASVFEERRGECGRLLEELALRETRSAEVIDFIKKRIRNLQEEKKELEEYQRLEHKRRCLEFELTSRDWASAQENLMKLGGQRRQATLELSAVQKQATELRQQLAGCDGELDRLAGRRQRLAVEHEELDRQRRRRGDELERLGLALDDERVRASGGQRLASETEKDLAAVKAELEAARRELEAQAPALAACRGRRRDAAQRRQLDEARRDQLLAKRQRLASYKTIAERNAALQVELRRHEARKEKCARLLQTCQDDQRRSEEQAAAARRQMEQRRGDIQKLQRDLDQRLAAAVRAATGQLEACAERKRAAEQARDRQQRQLAELDREASTCLGRLEAAMPRATRNALAGVKEWAAQKGKADAVYGTLLDNIEVPPEYQIAAESTAGAALFNLLVKDDAIGAEIITEVRTRMLGSIVCTPLNRVSPPKISGYPTVAGVKPLIEVVKCSDVAKPAVQQIFGRTLVCQSLELCDEMSRKYGFDTITTDGDKVSSRGTLSGGYINALSFTKIKNSMSLRAIKLKRTEQLARLEEARGKAAAEAEELTQLHNSRNTLQDERAEKREALTRAIEELHEAERQAGRHTEAAGRHGERLAEVENSAREVELTIRGLEEERASDVLGDLPLPEQRELERLSTACREHEQLAAKLDDECLALEGALRDKEVLVRDVGRRRQEELEAELRRLKQVDHQENVAERDRVCRQLKEDHKKAREDLDALAKELAELDGLAERQRAAKEELRDLEGRLEAEISKAEAKVDDLVATINAVAKKKHDADEKMRTMTFVSSDHGMYKAVAGPDLLQLLGQTTNELRKYEHVNKKAIDQHATFQGQLEELEASQARQRQSKEEVERFLLQVNAQKEETLKETWKVVDGHFRTIFGELVDGGRGRLVMVRADGGAAEEGDEGASEAEGVRVEVSFSGQEGAAATMAQLSGGQKTVVAIALIFAIQRLEPAPFYLFDEIDAALDTQYRTAVARLIERNSANAQMIITTFRPELIESSHQLFRVYQTNRVSRVEAVSKDVAREVIEEQARQEIIEG